ncbi:asparagine synthase (glutamine-hydrolyzing) [Rudaea cellulosilytica]|uniref:asparagine synthase (glutamine-hydrolyzing) n=1 Tax=Rudaea cellulosilytica TaxID=540746 RepID=UPI00146AEF2D|nr:asparagine synthase (glutamine-hydrolyzing) [Rudaea cellulosilytica]
MRKTCGSDSDKLMCGIAGLLDHSDASLQVLSRMLDRLKHRGPDDFGTWGDRDSGIALGHRRLSIIDLSSAGHQPMISASGRFVLIYNGEIYNFIALRSELEKSGTPTWRGRSDTEVLLAAFEAWGVNGAIKRCNGMFALALWDRDARTLTLARDRMGEKPLYFGWIAGRFAFASEMKALDRVPGWSPRMNGPMIASFLRTGYVQGPESAVEGIFRLPPGTLLQLTLEEMQQSRDWAWLEPKTNHYWSLAEAASAGQEELLTDADGAAKLLEPLLREAVALRMVADVPLGVFLSGGIDSSLVTALMQAQSARPVRSFSIGFNEPGYDEAPFALAVARHLGTDHTELYVDAAAALKLIPNLAETFDEPFADHSQLPTLLVSELTRKHVTVALTGDGGDELFAGYQRYFAILELQRFLGHLSPKLHRSLAALFRLSAKLLSPLSRSGHAIGSWSFRLSRLSERLSTVDLDAMRLSFIGGAGNSRLLRGPSAAAIHYDQPPSKIHEPLRRLMYGDQNDYLVDDILHKVDRASMAYGLETRVPLLDHRIVELSWQLAPTLLIHHGHGKLLLRRVLEQYVPRALFERPKQGFAPPMDAWLRGPLREWAESRLSQDSLRELPMLDSVAVRAIWNAHCRRDANAGYVIWNVLMLADWRERFRARC